MSRALALDRPIPAPVAETVEAPPDRLTRRGNASGRAVVSEPSALAQPSYVSPQDISAWWDAHGDALYQPGLTSPSLWLYAAPQQQGAMWYGPAWVDFTAEAETPAIPAAPSALGEE